MSGDEDHFTIEWLDRGHPPRIPPNPGFPDGVNVDVALGETPACTVELPYPTGHKNVGTWMLTCRRCGLTVGITAASRPDDPRSVKLPCATGQA